MIQESYFGRPFTLNTKGLSYRVGDKKANQMQRLRINWGQRAGQRLMGRAGLMHEIEAATAATTVGNYATTNRITLAVGSQFNEPGVDPDPVIRGGKSAIASQIGIDPNVMILGRDVYDVIATRYSRSFTATSAGGGLRPQLTEEILADIFGFARVRVCNALKKTATGRQRIFGKHIVMGYTNPAALAADRLPYRPQGQIDVEVPSFGYTYVYVNNPLMYNPYRDEDRGATVYKLDFDRRVTQTGVDRAVG